MASDEDPVNVDDDWASMAGGATEGLPTRSELAELMKKPMSFDDIASWLPGLPVFKYADFGRMKSIDGVLRNPHHACIFLYETRVNNGHFCALLDRGRRIEVFDPYGIQPDNELREISPQERAKTGQTGAFLSRLLLLSGRPVDYNEFKLQKFEAGVNTCGRHCITRIAGIEEPIDKYARRLRNNMLGLTPDEFVCVLINGP